MSDFVTDWLPKLIYTSSMQERRNPLDLSMILMAKALAEGRVLHSRTIKGFLIQPTTATLWQTLTDLGIGLHPINVTYPSLHKTYMQVDRDELDYNLTHQGNALENQTQVWDEGFIDQFIWDGELRATVYALDQEVLDRIINTINPFLGTGEDTAKIAVITSNGHGANLVNIGQGGVPLVRDNYTEKQLAAFDHIATDLANPHPCGRLVILTGAPGAGKTYYVEGLINAQPRCRFILLPPTLLTSIDGPELLDALLPEEGSQERQKRIPTVIIIEDADMCLVKRELDNLPAISTILNLADGIMGRALDIRLIATSNAARQDIDPALLRDGRLCRSVDFQALSSDQALQVYQRELKDQTANLPIQMTSKTPAKPVGFGTGVETTGMPVTLAEIYRAVKEKSL